MGKRKFHNKSYCMLEPSLIESEAFEDLSGKAAMLVLIRFHQKAYKKRRDGKKRGLKELMITNNGEIIFTYAEAKELGIRSTQTFHRVLGELIEGKGFIDVNYRGGYYHNDPSKYSISGRWKRYGTPQYEKVEIPRVLPKGIGFKEKSNFVPSK
ncbi:MAG: hypothetical protein MUO88_14405 [Desulfobacterales bacterium]|nr:hypothetical protein [Desulfobacterales bacterium]